MNILRVVLLFVMIVVSACKSANESAQPSVVLILDHLNAYEQALDTRIAAEQKYYAGHTTILNNAMLKSLLLERDINLRELIITYRESAMGDQPSIRLSRLAQFLATADNQYNAALIEYLKLDTEARTSANSAFALLKTKREELETVRNALQEILLKKDLELEARVKFWAKYIGRVNDELRKTKEVSATDPKK